MSERFGGDPIDYVYNVLGVPVGSRDGRTTALLAKYLLGLIEPTALVEAGQALSVARRKQVAKAFRFLAYLGVRESAMHHFLAFRALLDIEGEDSVTASYVGARRSSWVMPSVDMTDAEARAALGKVVTRLNMVHGRPGRGPVSGGRCSGARQYELFPSSSSLSFSLALAPPSLRRHPETQGVNHRSDSHTLSRRLRERVEEGSSLKDPSRVESRAEPHYSEMAGGR